MVQLFPVDFQARGPWAGAMCRDPTQWLPSARALNDSSRELWDLLGRVFYRASLRASARGSSDGEQERSGLPLLPIRTSGAVVDLELVNQLWDELQ